MLTSESDVSVSVGSSSAIDNDSDNDEADDGDDLDGREPELHLTVDLDTEEVHNDDGDEKRGDPSSLVDRRVPVCSSKRERITSGRACASCRGEEE